MADNEMTATRQFILVAAAIATSVTASTGINLASPEVRADPYTRTMAAEQEKRILREVERQATIDHLQLMQGIPPESVTEALGLLNRRVTHIETELRSLDENFRPEVYWE